MSVLRSISQGLVRPSTLFVAAASLGLLGACPILNTNHCAYPSGGAENACGSGFVCSACAAENNGCVPLSEMDSISEACLAGPDGTTTTTTSPTSTGPVTETSSPTTGSTTGTTTISDTSTTNVVMTDSSSSSSSSTTSTTDATTASSTGEPVCDPDQMIDDPDCADPDPYCVALGACGPCEELGGAGKACTDVDAGKPVCDDSTMGGSGRCVQCTKADTSHCPVEMPGCDASTGQCAKCTEHSECPDTACDIEVGVCFPSNSIIYVENKQGICFGGDGTEAKPFCSLLDAQPSLVPGKPTTIKIRAATSAMKPLQLVNPNYILALVRNGAQTPILDGNSNAGPTVDVSQGSRVYTYRLKFSRAGGPSVLGCTSGTLYMDEIDVVGDGIKAARAVGSSSCKTVARRSKFRDNVGGLQIDKGSLWMENCFVSGNGTAAAAFGAFNFIGDPDVTITYTTLARHNPTKSSTTFNCTGANTKIKVRNSAIMGRAPLQKLCTFTATTSLSKEAVDANEVLTLEGQWFSTILDGRFAVAKEGPLKGVAMWVMGDPVVDFDLGERSTTEPTYAGADESPL